MLIRTLVVGTPTVVLKTFIQSLGKKYKIRFIGYMDHRNYEEIKESLKDQCILINRKCINIFT